LHVQLEHIVHRPSVSLYLSLSSLFISIDIVTRPTMLRVPWNSFSSLSISVNKHITTSRTFSWGGSYGIQITWRMMFWLCSVTSCKGKLIRWISTVQQIKDISNEISSWSYSGSNSLGTKIYFWEFISAIA
jgi:hypothetical protein